MHLHLRLLNKMSHDNFFEMCDVVCAQFLFFTDISCLSFSRYNLQHMHIIIVVILTMMATNIYCRSVPARASSANDFGALDHHTTRVFFGRTNTEGDFF